MPTEQSGSWDRWMVLNSSTPRMPYVFPGVWNVPFISPRSTLIKSLSSKNLLSCKTELKYQDLKELLPGIHSAWDLLFNFELISLLLWVVISSPRRLFYLGYYHTILSRTFLFCGKWGVTCPLNSRLHLGQHLLPSVGSFQSRRRRLSRWGCWEQDWTQGTLYPSGAVARVPDVCFIQRTENASVYLKIYRKDL